MDNAPPLELSIPADAELVELPAVDRIAVPTMDLRRAIESRTTVRRYSSEPLNLDELSYLLWCTQGLKGYTWQSHDSQCAFSWSKASV